MNLLQAFKMSFKSIASNKVRTILTMLGIIIGVAAVIILVSLVQGYTKSMVEYYQKQGVNKITVSAYQWNENSISDELYDYCLSLDNLVLGVTPNSQTYTTVKYQAKVNSDCQVYFGSDQYTICNNYKLVEGRDISYLDVQKYNKVCVIGAVAKENLFNYADALGKQISINGVPYTVVGVYEQKYSAGDWSSTYYDNIVVVPYTTSRYLDTYAYSNMSEFVVKAKDSASTTEAITRLTGFLSTKIDTNRGWFDVYSADQYIESSNEQTRMLSMILGGIAGIALLVGGIGIMNIMLVTVTERTREIGIRKAIGARRRSIISQFLIESGVISFVGGLIGIGTGYLLTLVLGKVLFDMIIMPSFVMSVGAAMFSIVIGIIFGIYPAAKASGLQPVDALRSE